jgi:hypothetical protein
MSQADAMAQLQELRSVTQKARSPPSPRRDGAVDFAPGISDIYVYV